MNKLEEHEKICKELHDTYIKKNSDYGDSFGKSVAKWGLIAAMVRMEDKWNRLNNLILNQDLIQVDESLEDTLTDLANYCLMTRLELMAEKEEQ